MTASVRKAVSFTPQQQQAIESTGISVGLSAGAGCGKTFVLTQRFLRHLRPGPDAIPLSRIAAITFTDKAAREMRDRIRSVCQAELQSADDGDRSYWLSIFRGIDEARISTIHSFCASLLRRHAVEAGVDPGFTLLEQAIADSLLEETVTRSVFDLIVAENQDVERLVLHFELRPTIAHLVSLVNCRMGFNFADWLELNPGSLVDHWTTYWQTAVLPVIEQQFYEAAEVSQLAMFLRSSGPVDPKLVAKAKQASQLLQEHLESAGNWWQYRSPSKPVSQASLDEQLAAWKEIGDMTKARRSSKGDRDPHDETFRELLDAIKSKPLKVLVQSIEIDFARLPEVAELSLAAIRLTQRLCLDYAAAKQLVGGLDFTDLLTKTGDLLAVYPAVKESVAASIDLLMVDEFQDTDPVQAEMVRGICGPHLATGKLFLVGDAKQSIYKFRGARPEVFSQLRNSLPIAGRLPLSVNFRSQPQLLTFVNRIFALAMRSTYEPLEPFDKTQHSPTPVIEFLFASRPASEEPNTTRKQPDDNAVLTKPSHWYAEEKTRTEADWLAARIASLLADPTPRVRDKDLSGQAVLRPVRPGDIVILFRALTKAAIFENALRQQQIDYYLVGGRSFFAQQEIFDIASLCRFLAEPRDEVALLTILRSPLFCLTDEAVFSLTFPAAGTGRAIPLSQGLFLEPNPQLTPELQERVRFAAHTLQWLLSQKDRLPLAQLLRAAIDQTGYDAALLLEYLGTRKVANLQKLIGMAETFDQAGVTSLGEFATRLERSIREESHEQDAVTLPEAGNVVRLMTIHQSKGLEFPIVFVADMHSDAGGHRLPVCLDENLGVVLPIRSTDEEATRSLPQVAFRILDVEAERQENLRVLYVALTRAADHLILSAAVEDPTRPPSPWLAAIAAAYQLDTGLERLDPLLGASTASTGGSENTVDVKIHRRAPVLSHGLPNQKRELSLKKLMESISNAATSPLPTSAVEVHIPGSIPSLISVSAIEAAAETLLLTGRTPSIREIEHSSYETTNGSEKLDPQSAELLGTALHQALQYTRWPAEVEVALQDSTNRLNRFARDFSPDVRSRVLPAGEAYLENLWTSPLGQELSKATLLHREIDFLLDWPLSSGTTAISGQIDCLYRSAAGDWHLVDYKTSAIHSIQSNQELLEPYLIQLFLYGLAASHWLGSPVQSISLVFARPTFRLVPFPRHLWNSNDLSHRITAAIEHVSQLP
jgi:ATP-dependent helicase/nuclease subunit A